MKNPEPAERTFSQGEFRLMFRIFGTGPTPALCFHGHGRSSEDFRIFGEELGSTFTFYSFTLFHHGDSVFPPHRITSDPLRKEELKALFQAFLDQQGIEKATLIGYSLGGKIALTLLELMPDRIAGLYLFATDGLKLSFWYWFASRTKAGRALYRFLMDHPKPFLTIVDLLHKTRILSAGMRKFVHFHLDSREKRELVHDVWATFRNIQPDLKTIRRWLDVHQTPLHLFFGKYDRIIPSDQASRLLREEETPDQVHLIEAGHELLDERAVEALKRVVN